MRLVFILVAVHSCVMYAAIVHSDSDDATTDDRDDYEVAPTTGAGTDFKMVSDKLAPSVKVVGTLKPLLTAMGCKTVKCNAKKGNPTEVMQALLTFVTPLITGMAPELAPVLLLASTFIGLFTATAVAPDKMAIMTTELKAAIEAAQMKNDMFSIQLSVTEDFAVTAFLARFANEIPHRSCTNVLAQSVYNADATAAESMERIAFKALMFSEQEFVAKSMVIDNKFKQNKDTFFAVAALMDSMHKKYHVIWLQRFHLLTKAHQRFKDCANDTDEEFIMENKEAEVFAKGFLKHINFSFDGKENKINEALAIWEERRTLFLRDVVNAMDTHGVFDVKDADMSYFSYEVVKDKGYGSPKTSCRVTVKGHQQWLWKSDPVQQIGCPIKNEVVTPCEDYVTFLFDILTDYPTWDAHYKKFSNDGTSMCGQIESLRVFTKKNRGECIPDNNHWGCKAKIACDTLTEYINNIAPQGCKKKDFEQFKSSVSFMINGYHLSAQDDGALKMEQTSLKETADMLLPEDMRFQMVPTAEANVKAFKTAHGMYLSAKKDGGCDASQSKLGSDEKWEVIKMGDSYSFKGAHGKYLAVDLVHKVEANLRAPIARFALWQFKDHDTSSEKDGRS